jgi:hypothetical protein
MRLWFRVSESLSQTLLVRENTWVRNIFYNGICSGLGLQPPVALRVSGTCDSPYFATIILYHSVFTDSSVSCGGDSPASTKFTDRMTRIGSTVTLLVKDNNWGTVMTSLLCLKTPARMYKLLVYLTPSPPVFQVPTNLNSIATPPNSFSLSHPHH